MTHIHRTVRVRGGDATSRTVCPCGFYRRGNGGSISARGTVADVYRANGVGHRDAPEDAVGTDGFNGHDNGQGFGFFDSLHTWESVEVIRAG